MRGARGGRVSKRGPKGVERGIFLIRRLNFIFLSQFFPQKSFVWKIIKISMQIINNAIWLSDKASCRVGISLKHLIYRNIKTSTGWPKIWTVLTTIFSLILSNGPIHVPKIYHNKKWKSCFLINNWPKKIKK